MQDVRVMSDSSASKSKVSQRCIFCKIAGQRDEGKDTELLFADEEYVAFRDYRPAGDHHYLIIPRDHVKSVGVLNSGDVPMVRRMEEIARQLLTDRGASQENRLLGFHWPFYTVGHLHLHAISPTNQMSFFQRIEFSSKLFGSVDEAVKVIENRTSIQ